MIPYTPGVSIHHLQLWVPDLGRSERSWGWLLDQSDAVLARVGALERAQRGDSGPRAALSGETQRERINTAAFGIEGFPSPTINIFSLGTNLKYDLDLFGGERRKYETATARTEAQRQQNEIALRARPGPAKFVCSKTRSISSPTLEWRDFSMFSALT